MRLDSALKLLTSKHVGGRVFFSAGISGISPVTGVFDTHRYKKIPAGIYEF
jgi:hypothetical protein